MCQYLRFFVTIYKTTYLSQFNDNHIILTKRHFAIPYVKKKKNVMLYYNHVIRAYITQTNSRDQ